MRDGYFLLRPKMMTHMTIATMANSTMSMVQCPEISDQPL